MDEYIGHFLYGVVAGFIYFGGHRLSVISILGKSRPGLLHSISFFFRLVAISLFITWILRNGGGMGGTLLFLIGFYAVRYFMLKAGTYSARL
jgi:hypothetical protein